MEQLPMSLQLEPAESGLGFALRTLRAHAVPFQRGMQWIDLRRDAPLDQLAVRRVAWSLNTDLQEFSARIPTVDPGSGKGWVRLGGQRFRRSVACTSHYAKVCPACLRERGIARLSWMLRATVGCVWHGYSLITRCERCCAPIGWSRPDVGTCRCGFPFKVQPQVEPAEPLVQAWLTWVEYSLSPADVRLESLLRVAPAPAALTRLSVDGGFRIAEALGLRQSATDSIRVAKAIARQERALGSVLARGLDRLQQIAESSNAAMAVLELASHDALEAVAHDPGTEADGSLAWWLLEFYRSAGTPTSSRTGRRPKGQLSLFAS